MSRGLGDVYKRQVFMDKYHLSDRVKIDEKIIKLYKLGTKREDSYENKKETE